MSGSFTVPGSSTKAVEFWELSLEGRVGINQVEN